MANVNPGPGAGISPTATIDETVFKEINFCNKLGEDKHANVVVGTHPSLWELSKVAVRSEPIRHQDEMDRHSRMVDSLDSLKGCPFLTDMLGNGVLKNKDVSFVVRRDGRGREITIGNETQYNVQIEDVDGFSAGILVTPIYDCTVHSWIVNNQNVPISSAAFSTALSIIASTALGLQTIHQKKTVHRDIHIQNVFLKTDAVDLNIVHHAIIDGYGLSYNVEDEYSGSRILRFIAPPELLRGSRFSMAGDVYQFGIFVACCILRKQLSGPNASTCIFVDNDGEFNAPVDVDRLRQDMIHGPLKDFPTLLDLFLRSIDESPANRPLISEWIQGLLGSTIGADAFYQIARLSAINTKLLSTIAERDSTINKQLVYESSLNQNIEEQKSELNSMSTELTVLKLDKARVAAQLSQAHDESVATIRQLRLSQSAFESLNRSNMQLKSGFDRVEKLRGDLQRQLESTNQHLLELRMERTQLAPSSKPSTASAGRVERIDVSTSSVSSIEISSSPPSNNPTPYQSSLPNSIMSTVSPSSQTGSTLFRRVKGLFFSQSVKKPLPTVSAVSAVMEDPIPSNRDSNIGGRLFACGDNDNRKLAISANGKITTPQLADLLPSHLKIIQSCGGREFSSFLTDEGNVWSIGVNSNGRLGIGNTTNQTTPVQISSLKNVIQIAAGFEFCLFLLNNGTVFGCGLNSDGQLGDGTKKNQSTAVQVKRLSDVKMVSCGRFHSLYLKRDGTVWISGALEFNGCSPSKSVNSVVQIRSLGSNVISVSCGYQHSLCLHSDGSVSSFGWNQNGQLGNAKYAQVGGTNLIFKIGIDDVISVSGGGNHSLFLKRDSTVWACGCNGEGRLGDGSVNQRNIPVLISSLPKDVIQIKAGGRHSLFLHEDGRVSSCGWNDWGQRGNGSTSNSFTPKVIPNLNNVVSIGSGNVHSLFIVK